MSLEFTLRRKKLISDNFGAEHLDLLIRSLLHFFNDVNVFNLRLNQGVEHLLLRVDNLDTPETILEFYVIDITKLHIILAYNPLIKK